MFGFPVIVSLINVITTALSVLIFHPKRTFKYLWTRLSHIKIKTIFHNIANGIDKMNNFSSEPIQNQPPEKKIANRNKALYILLVILIVVFVGFVWYISSLGKTKAEEERSFSVIKLSTIDMEQYDDLKPNSNGESPYIQLNKRIVNSKVILSENDESYLVVNAYIDETENGLKLYLFTNEQTIVEKNDVIVYKIKLSEKDNKEVLS